MIGRFRCKIWSDAKRSSRVVPGSLSAGRDSDGILQGSGKGVTSSASMKPLLRVERGRRRKSGAMAEAKNGSGTVLGLDRPASLFLKYKNGGSMRKTTLSNKPNAIAVRFTQ